jgi:hypothetical protein
MYCGIDMIVVTLRRKSLCLSKQQFIKFFVARKEENQYTNAASKFQATLNASVYRRMGFSVKIFV